MKNSTGTIVVSVMVGLWFLVSAASGERAEQPYIYYEEIDKKDFPCYDKWRVFPLTRDKVFRSLGLTKEQREEIERLRKQFRDDLLDFKRRHNESLLNVLDNGQRRKLEEKKGEINRYMRDQNPFHRNQYRCPLRKDNNYTPPINVGSSLKIINTTQDVMTWGLIKKEFN